MSDLEQRLQDAFGTLHARTHAPASMSAIRRRARRHRNARAAGVAATLATCGGVAIGSVAVARGASGPAKPQPSVGINPASTPSSPHEGGQSLGRPVPTTTPPTVAAPVHTPTTSAPAPAWHATAGTVTPMTSPPTTAPVTSPATAAPAPLPQTRVDAPDGNGYWLFDAEGNVEAHDGAPDFGDLNGQHPTAPIVSMSPRPQNDGYILVSADGGVFTFGQARALGSLYPTPHAAIVKIAYTASGNGYTITDANGTDFRFGDA